MKEKKKLIYKIAKDKYKLINEKKHTSYKIIFREIKEKIK